MNARRAAIVALLPGLLQAAPVAAQSRAPLWYLGAQASHVQPDSVRDASAAAGGTIFFGKPLGAGLALELNAFGQQFHARSGDDTTAAYGAGLDLNYVMPPAGGRIHLLVGAGGVYENEVAPFVRSGIGFYLPGFRQSFNVIPAFHRNHWLLRADLSWYGVFDDRVAEGERMLSDVRLSIGVVFAKETPWPSNPPPEPPPPPEVVVP